MARYGVARPRTLDLTAIDNAVVGAGYTLKGVDIELAGVVQQMRCETCANDVVQLLADGTEQILELEFDQPDPPVGVHMRLTASTPFPAGEHPRWTVLSWPRP